MVGTRYIDFFDENRDEVLGKRNGKRRIAIRFYYPGVETKGAVFCDGLTPRKKKWYGRKPDLSQNYLYTNTREVFLHYFSILSPGLCQD